MAEDLITTGRHPEDHDGYREIISARSNPEVGLTLGVRRLKPGESAREGSEEAETAVLALSGKGSLACADRALAFSRPEWIETPPTVVHCAAGESIEARSDGGSDAEIVVVQTANSRPFPPRYYEHRDVGVEHRGKGILRDTCYRLVRLVFDDGNGPPESNLVLGEVVNFAGRWSSYPPHSHPQPEIYYYRFDPPNGFGYGELGEGVFKIHSGDLLSITGNRSHCQVSAPGYNMYYLWAIRHLEGSRYKGFTFDPGHAWTLKERSAS